MTLHDYFINNVALQEQWHPSRNEISPMELSPHSRTKVWWRCESGHEWRASVYSVKAGTGCPYCAGKRPIVGQTDLVTTHPQVVQLWSGRNKLMPTDVTAGSHKKVWFMCEHNHEWEAQIDSVAVLGTGCPYCAGRRAIPGETDLATVRADMLEQWDYEKNTIAPDAILPSAHNKVWWKCDLGHSYEAAVFSRTKPNSSRCPYCTGRKVLPGFNDLATIKPALAKEWYAPLNKPLKPQEVSLGSNKKVWWRCDEGHVWQAAVYSRTRKKASGCPVCAGMVKQKDEKPKKRRTKAPPN